MTRDATPVILSKPPVGWNVTEGTLGAGTIVSGVGLHTGRKVTLRLFPRSGDGNERGILFRRAGQPESSVLIDPRKRRWAEQPLCSTLRAPNGALFRTVEHLLASLLFCEIDHALVEMDGEEVPILDGSAKEWVSVLHACGRVALSKPKLFLRVKAPDEFRFGAWSKYSVEPAEAYKLTVSIVESGFGPLSWEGELTPALFAAEVAPARSYGRVTHGLAAMAAGFALGMPLLRGARLSSVAAIFNKRVIGGLRFPDEFARHRALDACGDFSIAAAPLLGHFRAFRPSHRRNMKFMRRILLRRQDIWEWAVFSP